MYDAKKIIPGLIIFLALITFPFWYTNIFGNTGGAPEIERPIDETECVQSKEYMRSWHMDLLNNWRDEVVRNGDRVFITKHVGEMKEFDKSLTNTCLRCHKDREQFCKKCHDYVGVVPYCWKCHSDKGVGN